MHKNNDETKVQYKRGFSYQNAHWLWLSAAVFLADQVTKRLVMNHMDLFDRIPLTGFLNFTRMHNTGAAFSILSDSMPWILVTLAAAVSIGILIWLRCNKHGQNLVAAGLCLILGGALANALDRVLYGYVVDFIDFYYQSWHYPAFNVADCAIVTGGFLLLWDAFVLSKKRANNS